MNLEEHFKELVEQLPTSTQSEKPYIFSELTFSNLPRDFYTNSLCLKKGEHHYGSYRNDQIYFHAYKNTYRCLGLLILAVIFSENIDKVHLELTHPCSDIKHLIINYEHIPIDKLKDGYHTRPHAFVYFPEKEEKHPWLYRLLFNLSVYDLPCINLTNREDTLITKTDWDNRDTLIGFGNDKGQVLFAELLLNVGCPDNVVEEYELEGEQGFRGVSPRSAEITLILPGHNYWLLD
ncbi:MAG: hypothetical protein WAQ98_06900 [Blastocatellia bacterium]